MTHVALRWEVPFRGSLTEAVSNNNNREVILLYQIISVGWRLGLFVDFLRFGVEIGSDSRF